jgi:flagellar motor protein MotB
MVRLRAELLAAIFSPMLLAAACSSSPVERSAQELGYRLQAHLAPDIAGGGAVLEQLPDGARVTLGEQALFPSGSTELDDKGRYVLASVIEALLAPRLLRIEVAESGTGPVGLQAARAQAVTRYFEEYGLGPALQVSATPSGSVGAAPQELTITVRIVSS